MSKRNSFFPLLLTLLILTGGSNPNVKGWNEGKETTEVITEAAVKSSDEPTLIPQSFDKMIYHVPEEWEITSTGDITEYKYGEENVVAKVYKDRTMDDAFTTMNNYIALYHESGMDYSGVLSVYPPNYQGFSLTGNTTAEDGTERYFRSENVIVGNDLYRIEVYCNPGYTQVVDYVLWGMVFINN